LANYSGKRWLTSPLANKRNWNYNVVPAMNQNYYWQPETRNLDIEVNAQPVMRHKV